MSDWNAISAILAAIAILMSFILLYLQIQQEKRYLLLPLFDQVRALHAIDQQKPDWEEVVKTINSLELIAVAWQEHVIDRRIAKNMFRTFYTKTFDSIEKLVKPQNVNGKSIADMLEDAPSIAKLNSKWEIKDRYNLFDFFREVLFLP